MPDGSKTMRLTARTGSPVTASATTERPTASILQPPSVNPADQHLVLILNHNRDDLTSVREGISGAGYRVMEAGSLGESHRILQRARPDVVILNPLILRQGGVELELIEEIQKERQPVPVILVVHDVRTLDQARSLRVPFRDFLISSGRAGAKGVSVPPAEAVHRIELALQNRQRFRDLQNRTRYLEGQVSVDFKTGLLSERYFRRVLAVEFKRAQRHQNPMALLLCDVDNFKRINDTTEYAFGDLVLTRVADALKQNVRDIDYPARMGGDEFVVLLPNTSAAQAVQTALRIRQRISGVVVQDGDYQTQVSLSIGIEAYDGRSQRDMDSLTRHANQALKEAKRRGKNQVWLFTNKDGSVRADSVADPAQDTDAGAGPGEDPPSSAHPDGA